MRVTKEKNAPSRKRRAEITTPVLTIFSAPKPFSDPFIAMIQRNAIQSWLNLGAEVEVLLVGEEAGLDEAAAELGVPLLREVRRSPEGTPLVSSIFDLARQASRSPLLAYLNADILALPDLVTASQAIAAQVTGLKGHPEFLLIGQRWDLEVTQPLTFGPHWAEQLRQEVQQRGRLHPPQGSDYFVFPRQLFTELPDFAIGRAGWDNWMIYHARSRGWPAIDGSPCLMIVHQNHDYRHLPGGRPHYTLEESERNQALAGGVQHMFTLLDTDHALQRKGESFEITRPPLTALRLLRQFELWLAPVDRRRQGWRWALARRLRRLRRRMTGEAL